MRKHSLSEKHKKNLKASNSVPKSIIQFLGSTSNDPVQDTETKIAAFLIENNLPFLLVDKLVPFLKNMPHKNVTDKVRLGKQKVTNIVRQGLPVYYKDMLVESLKKNPFSIIIDETTDFSTAKQLAFCVSFSNENLETEVDLIDLVECPNGTAEMLFSKLRNSLQVQEKDGVPLTNWIGFCSDTASVMMGAHHSVSSLIRENYPWVTIVKCSCHQIHLVASYACKTLPKTLEDLCRTIYNHFANSAKRVSTFGEFQDFCNMDRLKILAPGQTRWLSVHACLRRILQLWEPLKLYFWNLEFEDPTYGNELVFNA